MITSIPMGRARPTQLPVRPEPVEGLLFSWHWTKKGQGFDKLSPSGVVAEESRA
jgi:hypothetical protein